MSIYLGLFISIFGLLSCQKDLERDMRRLMTIEYDRNRSKHPSMNCIVEADIYKALNDTRCEVDINRQGCYLKKSCFGDTHSIKFSDSGPYHPCKVLENDLSSVFAQFLSGVIDSNALTQYLDVVLENCSQYPDFMLKIYEALEKNQKIRERNFFNDTYSRKQITNNPFDTGTVSKQACRKYYQDREHEFQARILASSLKIHNFLVPYICRQKKERLMEVLGGIGNCHLHYPSFFACSLFFLNCLSDDSGHHREKSYFDGTTFREDMLLMLFDATLHHLYQNASILNKKLVNNYFVALFSLPGRFNELANALCRIDFTKLPLHRIQTESYEYVFETLTQISGLSNTKFWNGMKMIPRTTREEIRLRKNHHFRQDYHLRQIGKDIRLECIAPTIKVLGLLAQNMVRENKASNFLNYFDEKIEDSISAVTRRLGVKSPSATNSPIHAYSLLQVWLSMGRGYVDADFKVIVARDECFCCSMSKISRSNLAKAGGGETYLRAYSIPASDQLDGDKQHMVTAYLMRTSLEKMGKHHTFSVDLTKLITAYIGQSGFPSTLLVGLTPDVKELLNKWDAERNPEEPCHGWG